MRIISRITAVSLGLHRYYTGKSCSKGHLSERFVSSYVCIECMYAQREVWRDANRNRVNEYSKDLYHRNVEKSREKSLDWYYNNYEKALAQRKNWRRNNSKQITDSVRQRRQRDINIRIKDSIRTRIGNACRRKTRNGSAIKDLGCTWEKLKEHLENQFQEGMSWENYGKWEIDHIKPLRFFDLANRDQFLEACHFTNLRPLWSIDNKKRNRMRVVL